MAEQGFSVKLTARVDAYLSAMQKAGQATKKFADDSERSVSKLGGQMQSAGRTMSTHLTLPIIAAGGAAVKMSVDYERAFAQMQGLAGVTAGEVDGLKASVLELSGRTATAPQELAEALYFAKSAGLDTAGALKAVESAAKASAAGMGSASDVVGLVASATASYGAANISAAEATDILTSAIREGRADPDELAGSLGRVLPVAASLGITFDQVGGTIAYLSNIFGDTDRAVTSMNDTFAKLAAPADSSREVLKKMGTSSEELKATIAGPGGLVAGLQLLRDHGFAGNSEAIRELMPDMQGATALTALLADASGDLEKKMDAVKNSTGSLDTAFGAMADTGGFKMKQAWVDLQAALIQAGDIIVPIVADIAEGVGSLVNVFADLPEPVQKVLIGFLAVVAVAGPILRVVSTLMTMRTALVALRVAMAAHPLLTLAVVVGAVAAAVGLFGGETDHAADRVRDLRDAITEAGSVMDGLTQYLIGVVSGSGNLAAAMAGAGVEIADLGAAVAGGGPAFDEMYDRLMAAGKAAGLSKWEMVQLGTLLGAMPDETTAAAAGAADLEASLGGAADATSATSGEMMKALRIYGEYADGMKSVGVAASTSAGEMMAGVRVYGEYADMMRAAFDPIEMNRQATEDAAAAQQAFDDATAAATDSLNAHIDALEADMEAQQALIDFARGAADAQFAAERATDEWNRTLEEMPGKLDEIAKSEESQAEKQRQVNEVYRDGVDAAAAMADATVTAYQEAADGTLTATQQGDLFRTSMLAQAAAASGPLRQSILDYLVAVNEVPADKVTMLEMYVEAGMLAEAQTLLDDVSETRDAEIKADADERSIAAEKAKLKALEGPYHAKITVSADTAAALEAVRNVRNLMEGRITTTMPTPSAPRTEQSAAGRFVPGGSNMLTTVAEVSGSSGDEVILPLGDQTNLKRLLADPRVSGRLVAALGGSVMYDRDGSVSAGTLGRFQELSSSSAGDFLHEGTSTAGGSPGPVAGGGSATMEEQVKRRQFERGQLATSEYLAFLEQRRAGLEVYSDEEDAVWKEIQRIRDQEAAANRSAADEAQKLAAAQIEAQDTVQKFLYDSGQISLAEYMAYLAGRQASFATYSADWLSLTREMMGLQKSAEADAEAERKAAADTARKAEEDAVKAHLDMIESMFDTARNRRAFADAAGDVDRAIADLDTAGATAYLYSLDKNRTGEERSSALAELEEAKAKAAEALYRRADAGANASGLDDNTVEWGQDVRAALLVDRLNAPVLAAAIDRILVGLPSFGGGGYINGPLGAPMPIMAHGGEYMLQSSQAASLERMLSGRLVAYSGASGPQTSGTPNVTYDQRINYQARTEATVAELSRALAIAAMQR